MGGNPPPIHSLAQQDVFLACYGKTSLPGPLTPLPLHSSSSTFTTTLPHDQIHGGVAMLQQASPCSMCGQSNELVAVMTSLPCIPYTER